MKKSKLASGLTAAFFGMTFAIGVAAQVSQARQAQMVAEGIKKVDLWEKNTTSQIDKDRLAMLTKIKKEERNNDMMGRRMASVNEIATRDTTNVYLGAEQRRKCFKTEKRSNCFERP